MAYDPADNETVLFGGYNPFNGGILGDTWTYQAGVWTQLSPSSSPSARSGFVLTYDPTLKGVVLFGGEVYSRYFGDTWLFSGGSWTSLSPIASPHARSQYAMCYDPFLNSLILVGGTDGSDLSDTWSFNGTNWTPVASLHTPGGRQFASLTYDGSSGNALLVGGLNNSSTGEKGTWALGLHGWHRMNATTPQARSISMTITLPTGTPLMFGGQWASRPAFTNKSWEFQSGGWVLHHFGPGPSARKAGGLVYDSYDSYVLLFGGADTSWLGDTWALY